MEIPWSCCVTVSIFPWVLIVCAFSSRPTSQETHRIGPKVFAFPQTGPSKMAQLVTAALLRSSFGPKIKVSACPAEPSCRVSAQQLPPLLNSLTFHFFSSLCFVFASSFTEFLDGHRPDTVIATSPSAAFFTETTNVFKCELVTPKQEPLPSKAR